MDWGKIATFSTVLSLPASVSLYVGWAVNYGPKLMSKQMAVMTLLFLCFLTILGFTTFSVYKLAYSGANAFGPRPAEPEALLTKDISRAVYVGRITISTAHLSQDHYLQLTIFGFNGSSAALSTSNLDGFITCSKKLGADGASVKIGRRLPAPSMNSSSQTFNPGPLSEFSLIIDQMLPGEIAEDLAETLRRQGDISLDLTALNIWIAPPDRSSDRQRLRLWDIAWYSQREGLGVTNRGIVGSAHDSLRTWTTERGSQ